VKFEDAKRAVQDGQLLPILDCAQNAREAAEQTISLARIAREFHGRRLGQFNALVTQTEEDATTLEELREENTQLTSALGAANEEIRRLRIENHRSAQRAFKLQPGLRVRVGDHLGEVVDQPVMVPVLFDGMHVTGRFDEKFVHWVPPTGTVTDGAGKVIGEATGLRVTPLEPREEDGTPIPYALVDRPVPVDGERRRFHHQPGDASDYLEALAEEVTNGPRELLTLHTLADREELTVRLRFNVPSKRGELSDLLYVAHPANRAGS